MAHSLRAHDISAVFNFLRSRGWSQTAIANATGLSNSRVAEVLHGTRTIMAYDVLARIADGLAIDRGLMGLAYTQALSSASPPARTGELNPHTELEFGGSEDPTWGLLWTLDVSGALRIVTGMWRADMDRRNFLVSAGFAGGGFAAPARDWLLGWPDTQTGQNGSSRRVGKTDVDMLWLSCHSFQEMDRRLGGGYARTSLVHFLNNVVTPMLEGTYSDAVGRDLMAVAARLTDIAAYSAYDAHEQGLAQRYYIQALRLARSAGNDALGAHILGDMTRQSYYVGELDEAVSLARAGQQAAARAGCRCGVARCASLEARALAMQGDRRASEAAMNRAESAMEASRPDDEPDWIKYFSRDQLEAEFAHTAEALHRPKDVLRFADNALAADRPLERRNVLVGASAARAHAANGDVDKAAELGHQLLDTVNTLSSERAVDSVRQLQAVLQPHSGNPAVQGFQEQARSVLPA